MSVWVKVSVGVVSAAFFASPSVVHAGNYAGAMHGAGDHVIADAMRETAERTGDMTMRASLTAVSDVPPFRLGRAEPERRLQNNGRSRPYLSPGRKLGVKKQRLPDQCLRVVETRRGDRLGYSARCLSRQFRHASKLPRACLAYVRTWRQTTVVYGSTCLARDGWRVARR